MIKYEIVARLRHGRVLFPPLEDISLIQTSSTLSPSHSILFFSSCLVFYPLNGCSIWLVFFANNNGPERVVLCFVLVHSKEGKQKNLVCYKHRFGWPVGELSSTTIKQTATNKQKGYRVQEPLVFFLLHLHGHKRKPWAGNRNRVDLDCILRCLFPRGHQL